MGSEGPSKRPFCNHCSKPLRTCLCSRFTSPPIDNSIAITVLQHNLEKRHPLNSIRIAKLGLRNLSIISISDVNLHSSLLIRPLDPNPDDPNPPKRLDFGDIGQCRAEEQGEKCRIRWHDGCISIRVDRGAKPNMKSVLASPIGKAAITNGFTAKKIQTKQTRRGSSDETEDVEEYEIVVPAGTALLYPGDRAMVLEAVDFEVKQLIVLDGTWGKARRMYCENPWLQLMPRLRLDWKSESLYSEVRHEPKAGCLSTIESIMCALKALQAGEEEKLDELLMLFESMVGDQRRLKDEKFKRMESKP
ncbi:putative DTW domain-containing protein DTWD2/YfiP [Dioscorea sansibarensis]